MKKVVFAGTHRVRSPERTLEIITQRLASFGITRLADVTGFDDLGIPVVMAVRPLSRQPGHFSCQIFSIVDVVGRLSEFA
jgi:ribosomal protein S12 methylthiotransferase accessory factor